MRRVGGNHLRHVRGPAVGQPHPGHHDLAGAVERPFVRNGRHCGDHRSDSRPDDGAVSAEDGSRHSARGRRAGSSNDLADGQACLRRGGRRRRGRRSVSQRLVNTLTSVHRKHWLNGSPRVGHLESAEPGPGAVLPNDQRQLHRLAVVIHGAVGRSWNGWVDLRAPLFRLAHSLGMRP